MKWKWKKEPPIPHCRCVILREGSPPSRCPNPVPPGEDRCTQCADRHPEMMNPSDGRKVWVLTEPDYGNPRKPPRPPSVGLDIMNNDDS